MTTTTEAPSSRVTSRPMLDRAVAAMATRRRAEVEVVESALAWAHSHVSAGEDDVAGWRSDKHRGPGVSVVVVR